MMVKSKVEEIKLKYKDELENLANNEEIMIPKECKHDLIEDGTTGVMLMADLYVSVRIIFEKILNLIIFFDIYQAS